MHAIVVYIHDAHMNKIDSYFHRDQSSKSGRAFRVGLWPGSGLTFRKASGLFWAGYDACK